MPNTIPVPCSPCYPDLQGRCALVTGGGSGIGRASCIRLAQEGMRVAFCGRTQETLEVTARLVRKLGGEALPLTADVSDPAQVDDMLAKAVEAHGPVDVLVNNAALMGGRPLLRTEPDRWRRTFATNIDGVYYLTQPVAQAMAERRTGAIIMISTIGALRAHYGMVAYDATKGAMEAFTRSTAVELAPCGVRVNAIAPGSTRERPVHGAPDEDTRMMQALGFEIETPAERHSQPYVPMGRHATPAEMAAAVAFLASNQSSYVCGHTLVVDGGSIAQISPRGARI